MQIRPSGIRSAGGPPTRRRWSAAAGVLTVDLDAIVANWRKLERPRVPAECAAVVKANAYGCGVEPVARALAGAGCKTFFVATLDEARVRPRGVPSVAIYVLDGFFAEHRRRPSRNSIAGR